MNVSAIIMASGLSKRMNQNKLQMKIKEKYLYEYIFETIENCSGCFNEIIVVAKDDEILKSACGRGFKTVRNEMSHFGQSASVKLGIKNSKESDGYMFFVADQPFIKEGTIIKMLNVFEKSPHNIVRACNDTIAGNPVIFSEVFKEQLLKLEGDTGGKAVMKENMDKVINVQIQSEDELMDIDTAEDYDIALKKVNR